MIDQIAFTNRDRPARNPGGMECAKCECIFIGEEWHTFCAVCNQAFNDAVARRQKSND